MAKLTSNRLTLEISFREFDKAGWVQYEVLFLWENEPLINDALLKRHNEHWSARSFGAFKANQYRQDDLITTIEKVLETNEPDYWEPLDPDVIIAIYPDTFFPMLKSHYRLVRESDESSSRRELRKQKAKDKLPDDPMAMIVFVDTYNLKNADSYSSEGLALIVSPTRQELETFCMQLRQEYSEFKTKYQVDEYQEPN